MLRCYEDESKSPRDGCSCRSCYYARERLLPTELLKFVAEGTIGLGVPKPSRGLIHQAFITFCAGRCSLEEMWVMLIKEFARRDDTFTQEALDRVMREPLIIARETRG